MALLIKFSITNVVPRNKLKSPHISYYGLSRCRERVGKVQLLYTGPIHHPHICFDIPNRHRSAELQTESIVLKIT